MTLSTLLTNLYRRLHFADTPDTAVTTRLTMLLNQRHRELLTSNALKSLRFGFTQFDSVASQPEYGLPFGISQILGIREATNDRTLGMRSWEWYRQRQPDPAAETGTPDVFVPLGQRAIFRRPAGTGVWVNSGSVGDTTQIVTIQGILANVEAPGAHTIVTATLNGTTRVRLGTTQIYYDIPQWSVSATCNAGLTMFDAAAGGNTLGFLPIGRQVSRNTVFALSPTPASALTYYVDFEHALVDLSNAWDQPLLPEDFHDILVFAVLMDEYEGRDDSRYATAEANYRRRLSDLKCFLFGHRAATQPRAPSELAPLGPWFPYQAP